MPNQRKVHKCLVPRLGGISFMPSMLLSFFIVTIIMGTQSVDAKITISTRIAHQPPHHLFYGNRGRLDRSRCQGEVCHADYRCLYPPLLRSVHQQSVWFVRHSCYTLLYRVPSHHTHHRIHRQCHEPHRWYRWFVS